MDNIVGIASDVLMLSMTVILIIGGWLMLGAVIYTMWRSFRDGR